MNNCDDAFKLSKSVCNSHQIYKNSVHHIDLLPTNKHPNTLTSALNSTDDFQACMRYSNLFLLPLSNSHNCRFVYRCPGQSPTPPETDCSE
jgi:hypothetical protein